LTLVPGRPRFLLAVAISNFTDPEGFKKMYGSSAKNYWKILNFGRKIACNKTGCS